MKELGLYVLDIQEQTRQRFLLAPKRLVKYIHDIVGRQPIPPEIMERHSGSIEELINHWPEHSVMSRFPKLRVAQSLDTDLLLEDDVPVGQDYVRLQTFLPPTIERITFKALSPEIATSEAHTRLLRMIADIAEDRAYPNLRECCICAVWTWATRSEDYGPPAVGFEADPKIIARIEARDINLHWHKDNGEHLDSESHDDMHPDFNNGGIHIIDSDPRRRDRQLRGGCL